MKKNYEEIDQLIRQALSEEEARFYDELDEQNLFQMVGGLFKGKNRWLTIVAFSIMPILFAGSVYCAFQFYQAAEVKSMMMWCAGTFFLLIAVGFVKMYHFLQMDKNAILREVKRMELQVAMLNSKLEKKN